MGLFKEIYCAHCGKKTNIITRMKLKDGNYICGECSDIFPLIMYETVSEYTLSQYQELVAYFDETYKKYGDKFKATHSYLDFDLDSVNRVFSIGYVSGKRTIFELKYLEEFDLYYYPLEYKEGFLAEKVVGNISLNIKMSTPEFCFQDDIEKDVKAVTKSNLLGTKIDVGNPKGMDEFVSQFHFAWRNALEEAQREYYKEHGQYNSNYGGGFADVSESSELQQAMNLFMIDNINEITLDELKKMRNRLIKTFHPDLNDVEDTKYAQKINAAFDILEAQIK